MRGYSHSLPKSTLMLLKQILRRATEEDHYWRRLIIAEWEWEMLGKPARIGDYSVVLADVDD